MIPRVFPLPRPLNEPMIGLEGFIWKRKEIVPL
jgi:hypothetical protein